MWLQRDPRISSNTPSRVPSHAVAVAAGMCRPSHNAGARQRWHASAHDHSRATRRACPLSLGSASAADPPSVSGLLEPGEAYCPPSLVGLLEKLLQLPVHRVSRPQIARSDRQLESAPCHQPELGVHQYLQGRGTGWRERGWEWAAEGRAMVVQRSRSQAPVLAPFHHSTTDSRRSLYSPERQPFPSPHSPRLGGARRGPRRRAHCTSALPPHPTPRGNNKARAQPPKPKPLATPLHPANPPLAATPGSLPPRSPCHFSPYAPTPPAWRSRCTRSR